RPVQNHVPEMNEVYSDTLTLSTSDPECFAPVPVCWVEPRRRWSPARSTVKQSFVSRGLSHENRSEIARQFAPRGADRPLAEQGRPEERLEGVHPREAAAGDAGGGRRPALPRRRFRQL